MFAALLPALPAADSGPVAELRIYTATPGNNDKVLARFRDHTMKLFEKHGMRNLGYAVPMDEKDGAGEKLIYVLTHKSREAAKESWKNFSADPEWKEVVAKSQANGKIVAKAETVFLALADFSPRSSTTRALPASSKCAPTRRPTARSLRSTPASVTTRARSL